MVRGSPDQAINVANKMISAMNLSLPSFTELDSLRANPFLFKDKIDISEIIRIIESEYPRQEAIEIIKQGKVDQVTRQASQLGKDYLRKAKYGQKIGNKSQQFMSSTYEYEPSCPPVFYTETSSASEIMLKDGIKYKFVKKCGGKTWWGGTCNAKIEKFIAKGYKCPHCKNIYQGC
ncbi:MAG: hypothetical protein N2558_02140 [Patescibacteria group bacterium]|nr:hypothetical protein [Patescibacteria group bacterium]